MRLPSIHGIIDRRILVNFRVDPEVVGRLLPSPFRPKLARGRAIAGICLIRLKDIRPAGLRFLPGVGSENAAHRFAVEWEKDGQMHEGVYIPRRDTSSNLNVLLGGRFVPGEHHHARFDVKETPDRLSVALKSDDGQVRVRAAGRVTNSFPADSIFSSLEEASRFFERGSLGYSATADPSRFDALELSCKTWRVQPLEMEQVKSSYFDNLERFPADSACFDCALLMRGVEHEWHSRADLHCEQAVKV